MRLDALHTSPFNQAVRLRSGRVGSDRLSTVYDMVQHCSVVEYKFPVLPLSALFLSGCTGRGLDTRLGLLLLALTEFIWRGDFTQKKYASLEPYSGVISIYTNLWSETSQITRLRRKMTPTLDNFSYSGCCWCVFFGQLPLC